MENGHAKKLSVLSFLIFQVLGGGRCLVHFTPEAAKPHTIDIRFNGEAVPGKDELQVRINQ